MDVKPMLMLMLVLVVMLMFMMVIVIPMVILTDGAAGDNLTLGISLGDLSHFAGRSRDNFQAR